MSVVMYLCFHFSENIDDIIRVRRWRLAAYVGRKRDKEVSLEKQVEGSSK